MELMTARKNPKLVNRLDVAGSTLRRYTDGNTRIHTRMMTYIATRIVTGYDMRLSIYK